LKMNSTMRHLQYAATYEDGVWCAQLIDMFTLEHWMYQLAMFCFLGSYVAWGIFWL